MEFSRKLWASFCRRLVEQAQGPCGPLSHEDREVLQRRGPDGEPGHFQPKAAAQRLAQEARNKGFEPHGLL